MTVSNVPITAWRTRRYVTVLNIEMGKGGQIMALWERAQRVAAPFAYYRVSTGLDTE